MTAWYLSEVDSRAARPGVRANPAGLVTALVTENHPNGLADSLFAFEVGGFAARTAGGAVEGGLAALTVDCPDRAHSGLAAA